LHVSATSHTPRASRQVNPAWVSLSGGHSGLDPLHSSSSSQPPWRGRQTSPSDKSWSGGHGSPEPSHTSAASHGPAARRQTTPSRGVCWQVLPSHESSVHELSSSAHGVPAGRVGHGSVQTFSSEQNLLRQSPPFVQARPSAHGAHVPPPQSTAVSSPSFTPLPHGGGMVLVLVLLVLVVVVVEGADVVAVARDVVVTT